jgi:hypothetical protein
MPNATKVSMSDATSRASFLQQLLFLLELIMFGLVWTGSVHGDGDLATSRDCLEHMALTPVRGRIRFPYTRLCIFLGALDPETFMQHVGGLKYFGVKSRTLLLL